MSKFSIGQEVVALSNKPECGLKKGKQYIVVGLKNCSGCGMELVDVGLTSRRKNDPFPIERCSVCKTLLSDTVYEVWWLGAFRFAPVTRITRTSTVEVAEEIKDLIPCLQ